MSRTYVQPESATQAGTGLYYCYDIQAWVRDGVIQACGHQEPFNGCTGCQVRLGARDSHHGSCKDCH
jgi:hypothetical protein